MTDSGGPPSNLPARRLSSSELEAVIRRAVELQSAQSAQAGAPEEGVSEAEVLRIGQELGLEPVLVRRAISDVRGRAPEDHGALGRVMGPGVVRAARTVRRPAAALGMHLEEYLVRCEYMVVQRRFRDRTRYVRGSGMGAVLGRAARKFGSSHAALDLAQVDVAVSAIDDETSLVELTVDTGTVRTGLAAGGLLGSGGAAAGLTAAVLATPIIDVIALAGIPLVVGTMWGMRGIYGAVRHSAQDELESFLDRVEHNELRVPEGKGPFGGAAGGFGGVKLWKV